MRFSRALRAVLALVCASAIALTAAGCAPADPKPTKTPTPTKTAIFASEEEALQAAVDVFQEYNAAYFAITSDGQSDYEKLRPLLTDAYFEEISSDTYFRDKDQHTEGSPSFNSAAIVSVSQDRDSASIRMKLCQDVSKVKIVDSKGTDVTPEDRREVFPWEVALEWNMAADRLEIEDEGSWQGDNFCVE